MTVTRKLTLSGYSRREKTECMVECEIDLETLIRDLGEKAFRNRSRKTRALGGGIKVSVRPCSY